MTAVTLPTVAVPKGRLTEAEARMVGASANQLVNLRGLQADCERGGSITVKTKNGAVSMSLLQPALEACLALLIERESLFLISMDVELDATSE